MSVNWLWKAKVGEVHYFDEKSKQRWKLEMFTGNMMCCFIYRYKQVNEETGKKEKYYNFFTWFNDIEHAKRVLKDDKDFLKHMAIGKHRFIKIVIYSNADVSPYTLNEMHKFARLLADNNYKVELKGVKKNVSKNAQSR